MKKHTIAFLVCTLMLGLNLSPIEASPDIHGDFFSQLQVGLEDPYGISGQQELNLTLEQRFESSAFYAGIKGVHKWPKAGGNQQWFLDLDEAYVDYYGKDLDIRFGRQRISWGTAMQINPTSVTNPMDITNPLGDKLPVYALNLDYYLNDMFKVTGVYVPFFKPALEAIPGNPLIGIIKPETSLENGEYAMKLSAMGLGGVDLSLSYFTGKEDLPTPVMEPGTSPYAIYRDVQIIGADFASTLGQVGVWAEGALSIPKDGQTYYQGVVGADYGFENGLIVMGQYVHQNRNDQTTNLLILGANQSLGLYEWRLGVVCNLGVQSFMFNPEVSYSLADATTLIVGARYFGNKNGPVGMLPQEQNQFYAQVKVSF